MLIFNMPPLTPIDPLTGQKLALAGRVVTMDMAYTVLNRGVVYIDAGRIVAVQAINAAPPAGFENIPVVNTRGTIFPGLIELHNHLSYNVLGLWQVPGRYTNRDQWSGIPEYRTTVSGPMKVIGMTPSLLPAVVRYVECKCLLGGVTTSQGIALFSNAGVRRYYRGIVRNVEQTDDLDLPEATARISDVDAREATRFYTQLKRKTCFLLHLSEGIDLLARNNFLALQMQDQSWAITNALAGIHCTGLKSVDFAVMASLGAAMIWSPLSNLLLYGQTADIQAAKDAGLRIGIGSDWSVSGSKNLLGELKVARLVSQMLGGVFSDRDLVTMATCNAAAILKWQDVLGSIETGKRADLLVIDGVAGEPYGALIESKETAIRLVMINGVPRYGIPTLMKQLGVVASEPIRVGGRTRQLFLDQTTSDPDVQLLTLSQAKVSLTDALQRLPELAAKLEQRSTSSELLFSPAVSEESTVWRLALDELAPTTGIDLRPRLPLPGSLELTGAKRVTPPATQPLSQVLQPIKLDPLTVADDPDFLDKIAMQPNLPESIKQNLKSLF